jgi:hypothetical protein
MFKREDLEKLRRGRSSNGSGGPFIYAPELEEEEGMKLAAAAPTLALACLEAWKLISLWRVTAYGPRAEIISRECKEAEKEIHLALMAAGVEG